MSFRKLLPATAGATILLGLLVGAAPARTLSTSSQTFRATFDSIRLEVFLGQIECRLTMEGSFGSRSVTKSAESLIGYITGATFGLCNNGVLVILRETLPWHLRYSSFSGELPNITSIRTSAIGFAFLFRPAVFEVSCLARSTQERPLGIWYNREPATRVLTTASLVGTMPITCPGLGTGSSTVGSANGALSVLNSSTRITVTLI
jgi:hypothetical protein